MKTSNRLFILIDIIGRIIINIEKRDVYMKKKMQGLIVLGLVILCITGCGKDENKTLTCNGDRSQSGIILQITAEGTFGSNKKMNDFRMEYFYDYTDLFSRSGLKIDDTTIEGMKNSIREDLEKKFKDKKGIEIKEIKNDGGKFYVTITGNIEILKKEYPEKFKKNGEFTYDGFKEAYDKEGLTCE